MNGCPFLVLTQKQDIIIDARCTREGIRYEGPLETFEARIAGMPASTPLCVDEGREDTGTCVLSLVVSPQA